MRPQLNWPFILCPFFVFVILYLLADIVQFYAGTNYSTLFIILTGTMLVWAGLLTERRVVMSHLPPSIRWPRGNVILCTAIRIMLYSIGVLIVVVHAAGISSVSAWWLVNMLTCLLTLQIIVVLVSYYMSLFKEYECLLIRNRRNLIICQEYTDSGEALHPFLKTPFVEIQKYIKIEDRRPVCVTSIDTQAKCLIQYSAKLRISRDHYYASCMPDKNLFLTEIKNWLATQVTDRIDLISLSFKGLKEAHTKVSGMNVRWDGILSKKELIFYL